MMLGEKFLLNCFTRRWLKFYYEFQQVVSVTPPTIKIKVGGGGGREGGNGGGEITYVARTTIQIMSVCVSALHTHTHTRARTHARPCPGTVNTVVSMV